MNKQPNNEQIINKQPTIHEHQPNGVDLGGRSRRFEQRETWRSGRGKSGSREAKRETKAEGRGPGVGGTREAEAEGQESARRRQRESAGLARQRAGGTGVAR